MIADLLPPQVFWAAVLSHLAMHKGHPPIASKAGLDEEAGIILREGPIGKAE